MKKAMVLGAISSFCDIVREMDSLGIEPVICDYYPDAPAKRMGYSSYNISTTDVPGLVNLAKEEGIEGVISAFSDRNLLSGLELCCKLNLPYFFNQDIVSIVTDKHRMKDYFLSSGLPIIRYKNIKIKNASLELNDMALPLVVKPIDAYGSKGITVCNDYKDIENACLIASRASFNYIEKVILEEYYNADEISITAWVVGGSAYITCIYDVYRNVDRGFTLAAVSFPSKYANKELLNFRALVNYIVKCFGIIDGPITLQCFIGENGLKVSELLCRLAGGSPYLYPIYLGGPNIAKMMIQNNIGEDIDFQNLQTFSPVIPSDDIYYDISVQIKYKGKIHYSIDNKEVMAKNLNIIDCRIYYQTGAELINTGKSGVCFAKVIYKAKRETPYSYILSKVDEAMKVYGEDGNKVTFIPHPQKLEVIKTFDIDWSFLREAGGFNDCSRRDIRNA